MIFIVYIFTILDNALRVAAINSVGDFILFLGKIGVTAATGAVGIVWFKVHIYIYNEWNRLIISFIPEPIDV